MVMFNGCKVVKDDVMVDVDILSTYISEKLGRTVGADMQIRHTSENYD